MGHDALESLRLRVVGRLTLDRLVAPLDDRQPARSSCTNGGERSDTGHQRVFQRRAAGLRSRRQVPVLPLEPCASPVYGDFDNGWTYRELARRSLPCLCGLTSRRRSRRGTMSKRQGTAAEREAAEGRGATGAKDDGQAAKAGEKGRGEEGRPAQARRHRRSTGSRRAPSSSRSSAGNYDDLRAAKGKVIVPAPAAHRFGRRQAPVRVLRPRRARGEDRRSRTRAASIGVGGRQQGARGARRRHSQSSISKPARSSTSRCASPRWKRWSIRAPSGGRCSPTRTASSATTSTTRTCTAWTGTQCATRYGEDTGEAP